jgi:hypothetical protein
VKRNRIEIGRGGVVGKISPGATGLVDQRLDQEMGPLRSIPFDNLFESFLPLAGLLRIYIKLERIAIGICLHKWESSSWVNSK